MDINDLLNPFKDSLINIFQTMLSLTPEPEKPLEGESNEIQTDITGTIGIVGDISGTVSVRFPKDLACHVASVFLGEDIKEINHEVKDAIGELANIVAGGGKGILVQSQGIDYKIAIPTVILGQDHVLGYPPGSTVVTLPFKLGSSRFYLEICVKEL